MHSQGLSALSCRRLSSHIKEFCIRLLRLTAAHSYGALQVENLSYAPLSEGKHSQMATAEIISYLHDIMHCHLKQVPQYTSEK